ncbi:hypothetical protein RvY_06150-3 [Ramazzottius varieornatus]|uniref:Guanylate cyclase n=1 Tax=Ramazzottius varieornatus TaxID=947166 RepID=A0A1D1V139_RAMVA|nr:hypothetical protein RvY_06150-3 [Ramazzottius varieornatus]
MREIRHDNLCEFVGACTDPVCIVMAYCQRGSLKDVLYDENLALDDLFLASLIGDCVKGMYYIHYNSSLKSHGNLKPSNCLIDSRFVLKITDYGLHEFKRKNESSTHRIQEQNYERMLWTAPELLRMDRPPPGGTPSGDVYSFGFILFEIYGRCGPFGDTTMSSKDIITQLRIGSTFMPFRPSLHCLDHNTPEYVISLILDAWKENPQQRPDFIAITSRLKPMQKGMKSNFVDNILALLQRHANNLESLVSERTLQLQEEKKKTELLLYEILPRPVAEHLIKHERVEAEQFESVTIFFSDIVGFTALSAESTPLEVVALLNDLYTLFDSLLEHYDAYKVETIGDSYMVCSGLPVTNGNRHAGVIASMSLQLLDSTNSFRIRHRPEKQLLLRIGIHSGPVVAGVVGLKMPRYCLFGDTVNTASRFESTGEAQKIHCSPQCKEILDELGGYVVEPRGMVYMKGKGEQLTYWLTDEDERQKQQRQLPHFNSMSELNRASPILSKWGSQVPGPRRRVSTVARWNVPGSRSPSPANSKRKLDVPDGHIPNGVINEEHPGFSVKGSLPSLLTASGRDLRSQYTSFERTNGDVHIPLVDSRKYLATNYSRRGSEVQIMPAVSSAPNAILCV